MRLKVSSSNTGSDESASSAAERASGVAALIDGLAAAATGGFFAAGGLTMAGGLDGATCGDVRVGWPATPCANAELADNDSSKPDIKMLRMNPSPSDYIVLNLSRQS